MGNHRKMQGKAGWGLFAHQATTCFFMQVTQLQGFFGRQVGGNTISNNPKQSQGITCGCGRLLPTEHAPDVALGARKRSNINPVGESRWWSKGKSGAGVRQGQRGAGIRAGWSANFSDRHPAPAPRRAHRCHARRSLRARTGSRSAVQSGPDNYPDHFPATGESEPPPTSEPRPASPGRLAFSCKGKTPGDIGARADLHRNARGVAFLCKAKHGLMTANPAKTAGQRASRSGSMRPRRVRRSLPV